MKLTNNLRNNQNYVIDSILKQKIFALLKEPINMTLSEQRRLSIYFVLVFILGLSIVTYFEFKNAFLQVLFLFIIPTSFLFLNMFLLHTKKLKKECINYEIYIKKITSLKKVYNIISELFNIAYEKNESEKEQKYQLLHKEYNEIMNNNFIIKKLY